MDLIIRENLKRYLGFRSSVYSRDLPFDTEKLSFRHKLNLKTEETVIEEEDKILTFDQLKDAVENCKNCDLHLTRKNAVFGKGSDKKKLVIIGEAPGKDEDESGEPFVGRAGQLLTKMLSAIDIDRDDVFICNVLKCRPPENRDPKPDEIAKCSYYLDRQLEFLKPDYILALGRIAALRLLKIQSPMKELRESVHKYNNIPVLVTYHPSALLRNPNWKYPAWEDLKKLKDLMDKADE
ncbi:MAG: uracil-DNA glycosylase [Candidatus Delongbacteria bacterium]|nr:uracil-DNA glycosylase [Candidatus Delongbacteria bacterium]